MISTLENYMWMARGRSVKNNIEICLFVMLHFPKKGLESDGMGKLSDGSILREGCCRDEVPMAKINTMCSESLSGMPSKHQSVCQNMG